LALLFLAFIVFVAETWRNEDEYLLPWLTPTLSLQILPHSQVVKSCMISMDSNRRVDSRVDSSLRIRISTVSGDSQKY